MSRLSAVKRNVISNIAGTAVVTVLTALITPLQINILGMEAYGIVGFIATLQVMFAAFDLGLSSTLTRELAADTSPHKANSQDLLRTATTIYWCSALLVGLIVAIFASSISRWWFHSEQLHTDVLTLALRVIALYLALRWPAALYAGVLCGLQRMDLLNFVKVAVAVIRLAGGVVVLLIWRSLVIFLIWTAISAVVEVGAYLLACKKAGPQLSARPGFSLSAVKSVWRFSMSMNALSIIAILIVQLDRLVISKTQPLEVLGSYNLAYTLASGIALVVAAINTAVFPWFSEAQNQSDRSLLLRRYHDATFTMMLFVGLGSAILILFGGDIIALWVNPRAARAAAQVVALLSIGFWISAGITNVYNVAVACGRPRWHLQANIVSIVPYAIALYVLVMRFGASGAAIAWILLNLGYAAYLVVPVHRELLGIGIGEWFAKTLAPPVLLAIVCFAPATILMSVLSLSIREQLGLAVISAMAYLALGFVMMRARGMQFLPSRASLLKGVVPDQEVRHGGHI